MRECGGEAGKVRERGEREEREGREEREREREKRLDGWRVEEERERMMKRRKSEGGNK